MVTKQLSNKLSIHIVNKISRKMFWFVFIQSWRAALSACVFVFSFQMVHKDLMETRLKCKQLHSMCFWGLFQFITRPQLLAERPLLMLEAAVEVEAEYLRRMFQFNHSLVTTNISLL